MLRHGNAAMSPLQSLSPFSLHTNCARRHQQYLRVTALRAHASPLSPNSAPRQTRHWSIAALGSELSARSRGDDGDAQEMTDYTESRTGRAGLEGGRCVIGPCKPHLQFGRY